MNSELNRLIKTGFVEGTDRRGFLRRIAYVGGGVAATFSFPGLSTVAARVVNEPIVETASGFCPMSMSNS
jgi:hypothetical protein